MAYNANKNHLWKPSINIYEDSLNFPQALSATFPDPAQVGVEEESETDSDEEI